MSQVNELLDNLSNENISAYLLDQSVEEHIIVNADRTITVPNSLKRVGVEGDHNAETLTFDCPRYWDEHDMSKMIIYIRYRRPDGNKFSYIATNIEIDENDSRIIHFNWTISKNVTATKGTLNVLICIEKTEDFEWHSELCNDMYISEGLDHSDEDDDIKNNADILTQLLELNKVTLERAAVYVGSGEMPDWANVQIDPSGEDVDIDLSEINTRMDNIETKLSKLKEPSVSSTKTNSPRMVKEMLVSATSFVITHTDTTYGDILFDSFTYVGNSLDTVTSSTFFELNGEKIHAQLSGSIQTNLWTFTAEKMVSETTTVDGELSSTSANPVQNKVIYNKIHDIETTIGYIDSMLDTL